MRALSLFLAGSLRNRFVVFSSGVALASALLVGGLGYVRAIDVAVRSSVDALASETRLMAQRFKTAYSELAHDAFVVSNTPPIHGMIRSSRNGHVDPLDGSATALWRSRLEAIFQATMSVRGYYTQMRYISADASGRELVRVNRTAEGLVAVPVADLQEKAGEPYVVAGRKLSAGEAYYSKVTYNRENGVVSPDRTPTVRVVVPVFDRGGALFGLIVINADYEKLLQSVLQGLLPNSNAFVVNEAGDYVEYRSDGSIGPLVRTTPLDAAPPFIEAAVDGAKSDAVFYEDGAIAYRVRLQISPSNSDASVAVVLRTSRDTLLAGVGLMRRDLLLGALALTAVAAVLAGTFASRMVRPVLGMARNIAGATSNSAQMHLPIGRKDEIGELARAFQHKAEALRESEAKASAVLDTVGDAIITIDDAGRMIGYNKASELIFGYSAEETIGKNISMLMAEPHRSAHDGYLARFLKTGVSGIIGVGRELTARRKDGAEFPIDLSIAETAMAQGRCFTGIVRDITERKAAEQEREHLIEKLARSNTELETLIAKLAQSNEELESFAYVASHDLKAPLRVIDNASCWLEEDLHEHLDDDSRENLQLLRSRVRRMERLLDDLLEYSRIGHKSDSGFSEMLQGDALLRDVLELQPPPPGFEVRVGPRFAEIRVARMPLQQIFLNLIGNAVKHHDKDSGRIEVDVEDLGERLTFRVRDDGPGIPEQYREHVFNMFQTLKPQDQVEGSGMGLAMVRKHVALMNGTLTLTPAEGGGCVFSFTWPKSEAMAQAA